MLKGIFTDFINIFFPPLCLSCNQLLVRQEQQICTSCFYKLPKTNFHLDRDNPMAQIFWGRVNIQAAAAFYYFEKGSKCRKILHHIKYRGKKECAFLLGMKYGRELSKASAFAATQLIIPVPLHISRIRKRGFNQSEWFAKGLAMSLQKEVCSDILVRLDGTETQTNKSRLERWENVEKCFTVTRPEKLFRKHILLVDDVITTGATLESCADVIISQSDATVSIATIAYA